MHMAGPTALQWATLISTLSVGLLTIIAGFVTKSSETRRMEAQGRCDDLTAERDHWQKRCTDIEIRWEAAASAFAALGHENPMSAAAWIRHEQETRGSAIIRP